MVCPRAFACIKVRLSSDGHSRDGGLRRLRRRTAVEGLAIAGVLGESLSKGILANIPSSAGRNTSEELGTT